MTTAQLIAELARRLEADHGHWRIELHLEHAVARRVHTTRILHERDLEPEEKETHAA